MKQLVVGAVLATLLACPAMPPPVPPSCDDGGCEARDAGNGGCGPGTFATATGQCQIDMFQLQQTQCRIELTHLAVDTGRHDGDLVDKTEVLEMIDALFRLGVRADDGPAFEGVEYLGGMKTQHRKVAMLQDTAAMALHPESVCSIVDDPQVVVVRNLLDGIHVTGVTITMHRHDGCGLRCDRCLDSGRVKIQGRRIDVDKYRLDPVPQHRVRGGDKRVRRGDHLAGNAQSLQCGDQRDGSVGEQRQMFNTQILAERLFQPLVKRTTVRQDLAVPYLPQVGNELLEWRQVGLGDVDILLHYRKPWPDAAC